MGAPRPQRPPGGGAAGRGHAVELESVPGADHFFAGGPDVEAIFERALAFLARLDAAAVALAHQGP